MAELDSQIAAHVDALVMSRELAWEQCRIELSWRENGEVFVAFVLAEERRKIACVLEFARQSHEQSRAFASALGWVEEAQAEPVITELIAADDPELRRMGIAGSAVRRRDPGGALDAAVGDDDELLAWRALRAVGELGRLDLLAAARKQLASPSDIRRDAAAWTCMLMEENEKAVQVLREAVEEERRRFREALLLAPRRMECGEALAWIERLARKKDRERSAVIAAGVLGDPSAMPWIIDRMELPELARVAGEAFSMITGVDIAYEDLEGEWPEGFEAGPNDDPEDENVEMDADENLPWPNRQKIADWWVRHRDDFQPGVRYLCGRPITEEWCEHVLRHGYQRQRAAAALELAIMRPGEPLFNVKAPGFRQQKLLGLK